MISWYLLGKYSLSASTQGRRHRARNCTARGRGGRNVLSPLVVDMIAREELAFTTAKVCSLFTPPLHAV